MSTVYIVQSTMRHDASTNSLVPKYDFSSANMYGELEYLLSPSASPFNPDSVVQELHEKLKNFSDQDYILCVGNPALIGFTVAIASMYSDGLVNLLQWSGKDQQYIQISSDVYRTR